MGWFAQWSVVQPVEQGHRGGLWDFPAFGDGIRQVLEV